MRLAGPKLRDSQGQVIVFLPTAEREALRAVARRHGLTLGESLAVAINAELARMGVPPPLTPGRLRSLHRVRATAAPRGQGCDTPGRRGLSSLAGWYDRAEVRALRDLSRECGRSLQDIARSGVAGLDGSDALRDYLAEAARLKAS